MDSVNKDYSDCALLVMSCDAYEDLWRPFFTLLTRYWPDCPFPVYIGAEQKTWPDTRVTTLQSEVGGRNWSGRLLDYLQQLRQSHVIIMLDDFFLRKSVQTLDVYHCLMFARATEALQVRLIPLPGPTVRVTGEKMIGECVSGVPYRLNTQAAIWGRTKLIELLRAGESIWEFEHNGNQRVLEYTQGFYAVRRAVLPYQGFFAHHVVEKGKWFFHEKWIFGFRGVGCDFSKRGTLPWTRTLLYHIAVTIDGMLNIFPWRTKSWIKRNMKKALSPILGKQFSRMHGSALPTLANQHESQNPK